MAAAAVERVAVAEAVHARVAPAAQAKAGAPEAEAAEVKATVLLVAGLAPRAVLRAAAAAMRLRPSNPQRGQRPNRSVETDAQVRPCAARTRLSCAGHLPRCVAQAVDGSGKAVAHAGS